MGFIMNCDIGYLRSHPKLSKSYPNSFWIDAQLAKDRGFTDEELDFIINYDVS